MTANATESTADPLLKPSAGGLMVEVNGHPFHVPGQIPTGRQILAAAGLHPEAEYALLLWPPNGPTQELGLDEPIDLPSAGQHGKFFAHKSDRIFYFVLDDERFAWAGPIDETKLRQVGRIPVNRELWLSRKDLPDVKIEADAAVDLLAEGVERIYTRQRIWKLDVQGVIISSDDPLIGVEEALVKAGIDPFLEWIIVLKVKGQPKKQVQLIDEIDLTQPGIERLRLTPKQINNGDGANALRRHFALLPKDEAFLNSLGYIWQTINDGRRWLLINDYRLPSGYHQTTCSIAIEVPPPYPAAELDMFYCNPALSRESGATIPQTEATQVVDGNNFQRWSRHRESGQWVPEHDCVITHLGLIEESLLREVES